MSVFDALVGQDRVVAQLTAASQDARRVRAGGQARGEMTHAWLFTGPPGAGREDAARAFAAALQCTDPGEPGCGQCDGCHQSLIGNHADVALIATEQLHLTIEKARELIQRSARLPTLGRWQVTVVENAERMEERTSNTVLKAVEEPPPHSVLVLCAPSTEDLLPTIRSRCRLVPLVTPSCGALAADLAGRDGIEPSMAAFAARAAQGNVPRARRLATDEAARTERREVLQLPRSLGTVGTALAAAKELVDAAARESSAVNAPRDEAEREGLDRAFGVGVTGKGFAGGPRGLKGATTQLEKDQKSRGTQSRREALDRALVDLLAFYRDVLVVQLGAGVDLVHGDLGEQTALLARATTAEATLHRVDAILACRTDLEENVAQLLAVEAMALALR